MENNKKTFIIGAICILGFTTILADVPTPTDPKEAELEMLLKKSEEQLKKVTLVAKAVDAATTEQVVTMKESIETLQEENQQLTTEIHEVKAIINSVPVESVPFKLEPIVSDSKN
jgi:seryl-tRNA synthetase